MRLPLFSLAALLASAGCASSTASSDGSVYDPFEGWNRSVYAFNEGVDKAVLEPAAKGYRAVTTEPIRAGVSNFLTNLGQPVVFANAVLQANPEAALDTVGRFLVNTTVGLGGVFDPATALDVPEHDEDFGQTLGKWGIGPGPYLMLPLTGPSNLRDAIGGGVDNAFDPLNYARFEGDTAFRVTRGVTGALSAREGLIETIEILREQPEPYTALRRNYTQQRAASIRDGKENADPFANLPEFDDTLFDDDN